MVSRQPLITFMSDFGLREFYVGAVKGVILSDCPTARIIDITHSVASHDLLEAAFTLASSFPAFPPGSIHLVVVDPGVGSERRGLIASSEKHTFVAPDNGVLSLVQDVQPLNRIIAIEADHYFRQPVSSTFHARDIFAPMAAQLARGLDPSRFGPAVDDPVRLSLPPVRKKDANRIEGVVLHVDKFGNVATSIRPADLDSLFLGGARPKAVLVGEHRIETICSYYEEGSAEPLMMLEGSCGYFEIAAFKKPAAQLIKARRGMPVLLEVETGG